MDHKLFPPAESVVNVHGAAAVFIDRLLATPVVAYVTGDIVSIDLGPTVAGASFRIDLKVARAAVATCQLLIVEMDGHLLLRDTAVPVRTDEIQ